MPQGIDLGIVLQIQKIPTNIKTRTLLKYRFNPYTVNGDTLIVDLHHDNELVATLTFECDGDKVQLGSANSYHLYRLGSNCP